MRSFQNMLGLISNRRETINFCKVYQFLRLISTASSEQTVSIPILMVDSTEDILYLKLCIAPIKQFRKVSTSIAFIPTLLSRVCWCYYRFLILSRTWQYSHSLRCKEDSRWSKFRVQECSTSTGERGYLPLRVYFPEGFSNLHNHLRTRFSVRKN